MRIKNYPQNCASDGDRTSVSSENVHALVTAPIEMFYSPRHVEARCLLCLDKVGPPLGDIWVVHASITYEP